MIRIGGWLGLVLLLASAGTAVAEEPAPGPFNVVLLSLKSDWQAMRYHAQTGDAWYALQGNWKPVAESDAAKLPPGEYQVFLSATGENDWIALRLDRRSGRSWRLAALKWVEMKVLEPDKPATAGAEAK